MPEEHYNRQMSEALVIAMIAAFPGLLTAVVTWIVMLKKVNILHGELNSRLSQLIESTRKASHAEGVAEGRSQREKP